LRPDARKSLGQSIGAQQKDSACFRFRQRLSHSAGVTPHQIDLELPGLGGFDALGGERTETRGYTIDYLLLGDQPLDHGARTVHGPAGTGRQGDMPSPEHDFVEILAREGVSGKQKRSWHDTNAIWNPGVTADDNGCLQTSQFGLRPSAPGLRPGFKQRPILFRQRARLAFPVHDHMDGLALGQHLVGRHAVDFVAKG